jgi:hypothetical protein
MRVAPIGYTLSQTIEISNTPEAKAYRNKINEWASLLNEGNTQNYQPILDDVNNAIKALNYREWFTRIGEVCTCIGIPLSVVGLVNPFAGVVGLSISTLGGISLGATKIIPMMNRWAMFGLKTSN